MLLLGLIVRPGFGTLDSGTTYGIRLSSSAFSDISLSKATREDLFGAATALLT
jgi:hypothetical protein